MRALLPALLLAALLPDLAMAYAVTGPLRVERMEAVLAWSAQGEVLSLSPILEGEGEGWLVLPVPAGALLAPPPPAAAFEAGVVREAASPPAGRSEARTPKAQKPGRATQIAPGRAVGGVGTEPAPEVQTIAPRILPGEGAAALERLREHLGEAYADLPEAALAAYAEAGWSFLVAGVPAGSGRRRLAPISVAFSQPTLVVPVRLAARLTPHTLSLVVLGPRALADLGGMEFTVGLREAGPAAPADPEPSRWAAEALGAAVQVRQPLVVPSLNGPRRPIEALRLDLVLPRPPSDATPPKTEAPAVKRGCGGCGCSSAGTLSPLAGVLLLFRRRRRM